MSLALGVGNKNGKLVMRTELFVKVVFFFYLSILANYKTSLTEVLCLEPDTNPLSNWRMKHPNLDMGREDHTEEVLTDNYTTTMVRDGEN